MGCELFTHVSLTQDLPAHNLRQGDVATIVDRHPVPDGEAGYSPEIFNAIGEIIAVITVAESQIYPFTGNAILGVRALEPAQ